MYNKCSTKSVTDIADVGVHVVVYMVLSFVTYTVVLLFVNYFNTRYWGD